jgi:hypothetical protein
MGGPAKRRRRPGKARQMQTDLLRDAAIPCVKLNAATGAYQIDRFFTELKQGIPE